MYTVSDADCPIESFSLDPTSSGVEVDCAAPGLSEGCRTLIFSTLVARMIDKTPAAFTFKFNMVAKGGSTLTSSESTI